MKKIHNLNLFSQTLIALILLCFFSSLNAADIPVNAEDDDTAIQSLIAGSTPGDTLVFEPGTYTTSITINGANQLNIKGKDTTNTILQSSGNNPVITVEGAPRSTIQNLTFKSASIAIKFIDSTTSNTDVINNIFRVGENNNALEVGIGDGINITLENNVFYDNSISTLTESINQINAKNNIFVGFDADDFNLNAYNNIDFNCFSAAITGITDQGNNNIVGDAEFVDPDNDDYHLKSNSSCIDIGEGNSDPDETQTDAGAFGGENSDIIPQAIRIKSVDKTNPAAVIVKWDQNLDYRISGYKIYYDATGLFGKDTESERTALDFEPISVPDNSAEEMEFTFTIFGTPASELTVPSTPSLREEDATPSNNKITLNWNKLSDANAYTVHYQSETGSEESVDVGDESGYEINNLDNSQKYTIWITARNELERYFQIVATMDLNSGEFAESYFIHADVVETIATSEPSEKSNEIVMQPEKVAPYPTLPDKRCFIATAAFGHYSVDEVQTLRHFRDKYLLTNYAGQQFVTWYYTHSPAAAKIITKNETLKFIIRTALFPLIAAASLIENSIFAFICLIGLYVFCSVVIIKYCFIQPIKKVFSQ